MSRRGIAQLVARCVRDAEALGSSPSTPTTLFKPEFPTPVFSCVPAERGRIRQKNNRPVRSADMARLARHIAISCHCATGPAYCGRLTLCGWPGRCEYLFFPDFAPDPGQFCPKTEAARYSGVRIRKIFHFRTILSGRPFFALELFYSRFTYRIHSQAFPPVPQPSCRFLRIDRPAAGVFFVQHTQNVSNPSAGAGAEINFFSVLHPRNHPE